MRKLTGFISASLMFVLLIMGCATTEPSPAPPPPVVEVEPEPVPEPPAPVEEESFVLTEEIFNETFVDIEGLIKDLNAIIRAEDFETWKTYLTEEYIETYSDQEKLFDLSQLPLLKQSGIRLRSLQDYFYYVVVPSRSQARLDDLVFEDAKHLKAYMIINGKRQILYFLEKRDDAWKIGI
jgi:hypothetical protein